MTFFRWFSKFDSSKVMENFPSGHHGARFQRVKGWSKGVVLWPGKCYHGSKMNSVWAGEKRYTSFGSMTILPQDPIQSRDFPYLCENLPILIGFIANTRNLKLLYFGSSSLCHSICHSIWHSSWHSIRPSTWHCICQFILICYLTHNLA